MTEHGTTSSLKLRHANSKVLRGSGCRESKPLQLFSAVGHRLHLILVQVPIEEKTNKILDFQV